MLSEKDYYFTIEITPEGYQRPYINYALEENQFLRQLIYFQNLRKSEGVKNAILIINKVIDAIAAEE